MAVKFQDLLNAIPNPETRDLLAKADEKSQEVLSNLFMMQSDYNRQLDGIKAQTAELTDLRTKAEGWRKYFESGTKDEMERRYREYPDLADKLKKAEGDIVQKTAELEAAKAAATGEVLDVSKVEEAVRTKMQGQFVTADAMKKMIDDAVKGALQTAGKHTEAVAGTLNELLKLSRQAERDLGITLDPQAIAEEAARAGSVDRAYENLTRDKYKEIETKKHKEEVDAAFKRGQDEMSAKLRHPEDMTGAQGVIGDMGPLESAQKHVGTKMAELPKDYELGQGAIAHAIPPEEMAKLEQV